MDEWAELDLELSSVAGGDYALRFRYRHKSEISTLGLIHPIPVKFDIPKLRARLDDPEQYGITLAEQLFAEEKSRTAFNTARTKANGPLRLRLWLDLAAPDLLSLCWETLHIKSPGFAEALPLFTDQNLLLSRFLPSASVWPDVQPERPRLCALVAIAGPSGISSSGYAEINTPKYLEVARKGLEGFDIVELAQPGRATLDNLVAELQRGVDVLYLAAHGSQQGIMLENEQGKAVWVDVEKELIARIKNLPRLPGLAVLVSCNSAGNNEDPSEKTLLSLGPELIKVGVPMVLAMQGSVSFDTMEAFLPVFFRELQVDGLVDRALAAARDQVRQSTDWWMPALFSRVTDNRLPLPARTPLTSLVLQQLYNLLQQAGLSGVILQDHYKTTLAQAGLPLPRGLQPASLGEILNDLAQLPPQADKNLLLLAFAGRLLSEIEDLGLNGQLQTWMERTAADFGAPAPLFVQQPAQEDAPGVLMIQVVGHKNNLNQEKNKKYRVSISLWQEGKPLEPIYARDEEYLLFNEAEQVILRELKNASNSSGSWPGIADLPIEVFLPFELLNEPVDQWPVTNAYGRKFSLGEVYPIAVRSQERAQPGMEQKEWRKRWDCYRTRIKAGGQQLEGLVAVYQDRSLPANLLRSLLKADLPVSLGLALAQPGKKALEVLGDILSGGVPIAIWTRPIKPKDREEIQPEDIVQKIKELLVCENLPDLPELVYEQRREGGVGSYLTLLYDDPDRLPVAATRLSAPVTRRR